MTDFMHQYLPGTSGETLFLLHGTGGNEQSLLPLGRALAPAAGLLAVRGRVLEGSMPRFFRRLAEGVFDQADLARRTTELAEFLREAAERYRFPPERVTAVGFSNGANIAASILLREPGLLRRALLLRAMVPFEPEMIPDLSGTAVRIGSGRYDPIVPVANAERLATIFRAGGAAVDLDWREAGPELAPGEVEDAARWIGGALPVAKQ
ncbi:MAG: alpha/beta hydrolase [Gemmatimonadetes bacterium]|nr:alpha/beta hydrolase [Gemmatimonadota bacterium]